jgi:hypothetical protein
MFLMLQGSPVNIIVGSNVWAEDPEDAWTDGEVIEINGRSSATIITTNGKTVSFSDLPYSWNSETTLFYLLIHLII